MRKLLLIIISVLFIMSGCQAIIKDNTLVTNSTNVSEDQSEMTDTNITFTSNPSNLPTPTIINETQYNNNRGTDIRGNTVGNIISGWDYASENNTLYSVHFDFESNNYALYKSNLDETIEEKIYIGEVHVLNVINGWIYYSDSEDNGCLYKIKSDGSNITRLINDYVRSVNIVGSWIYYGIYNKDGLYKVMLDGTNKTRLCNLEVSNLIVLNDWVYFTDVETYHLYKINTDGSNLTNLVEDETSYPNVYNGWIYYASKNGFYKMKTDGTQKTKIHDDELRYTNIDGEWIYYINFSENSGLYRMRLDGSDITKLDEGRKGERFKTVSIVGEWVKYIKDIGDDYEEYQIKKDGTEKKMIRPGIYSIWEEVGMGVDSFCR